MSFRPGEHPVKSQFPDDIADANAESIADTLQRSHGHALASGLQPIQMDAIQTGKLRKLILRKAFARADLLNP